MHPQPATTPRVNFAWLSLELWLIVVSFGMTPHDIMQMSAVSRDWWRIAHGIAELREHDRRDRPHLNFYVRPPSFGIPPAESPWRAFRAHAIVHGSGEWDEFCALAFAHKQRIHSIEAFHAVDNVDAMWHIRKVKLHNARDLLDVSPLSGAHEVDINKGMKLVDVGGLASVHTVGLFRCRMLTDVRPLGYVHTLTLSECLSLVDVSVLGRVHTLRLAHCYDVVDVRGLGSVHKLSIVDCPNVVDVSALGSVHTLDLSLCAGVSDVGGLGSVHTLTLCMCTSVADVSTLRGVRDLTLSWAPLVRDVSMLRGVVPKLTITHCGADY